MPSERWSVCGVLKRVSACKTPGRGDRPGGGGGGRGEWEPPEPRHGHGVSVGVRLTQAEAVYEEEEDTHGLLLPSVPGSPDARYSLRRLPIPALLFPDLGLLPQGIHLLQAALWEE